MTGDTTPISDEAVAAFEAVYWHEDTAKSREWPIREALAAARPLLVSAEAETQPCVSCEEPTGNPDTFCDACRLDELEQDRDRLRAELDSERTARARDLVRYSQDAMFLRLNAAETQRDEALDLVEGLRAELAEAKAETGDEHHTLDELYEYRMLYNAHAARGWLAAGLPVVKSWRHSDGELCFGGGWFIVSAQLPTGQVTNHYGAEHWDLFDVPEVELPPEYDGHTPADAAERLRAALRAAGGQEKPVESLLAELTLDNADKLSDDADDLVRSVGYQLNVSHPRGKAIFVAHCVVNWLREAGYFAAAPVGGQAEPSDAMVQEFKRLLLATDVPELLTEDENLRRILRCALAAAAVSGEQHSGSTSVVTPSVEAQPDGQPR